MIVARSKLQTIDFSPVVVEGGENAGSAKLPVIDLRMRTFVVTVQSGVPSFHDLLRGADVTVMCALRFDRVVSGDGGRIGGPSEFGDGALRDNLQRWWREVT